MFNKIIFLVFLFISDMMALVCSDYNDFKEYGGHYYTVTTNKMTFLTAKTLAENNGGYLAIPNSAQENAFITSLIKSSQYAWIGIYDPNYTQNYCVEGSSCSNSDTRFRTVKGSSLTYKNWAISQPNNLLAQYDILNGKDQVSPLGEHWVALGAPSGQWGDFGNHADEYNNPVKYYAVFEFDTMPECYTAPSTIIDTIEGKQCNTQIYDTTLDTVSTGKTYNCLNDLYGTSYCPASLAACSTEWDYVESTSVLHQICTDGSAPVDGMCKSTTKACDAVGGVWNGTNCTVTSTVEPTYSGTTASCSSRGRDYAACPLSNIVVTSVSLVTQTSDASCTKAGRYGILPAQNGMWVTDGCRGIFSINGSTCPLDYTWYDASTTCQKNTTVAPSCSNVSSDGYCMSTPNTYYDYLCSGTNSYGNTYTPTTTTGSTSTAPANNCKAESYKCQASPDRKCALVNSSWQCSPFPCISGSDVETTDTEVGLTDASNDGWSESGDCLGEIYIFNGQDNRCRSDDIFFGLFGGGCCDKDKVFLGLVACKEEEIKLAKLQKQERTHYVGQYCSKKLPLIGCIQKKKTFCAFNSKLGRIINEQGRTQLNKSWGDPKSPNCKGFTPEEFQKLDFSKLDLSEFFGDLQQNFNSAYLQNQATVIQNRMNTNLQNIAGQ